MYNIFFYKDKKGNEPVKEYIISLKKKNSKDSLIKLQKIQDYLNILRENGTRAGMPFVRHLDGELWELRPLKDRILFLHITVMILFCYRSFIKKHRKHL